MTPPSAVQLLLGNPIFVLASTPNTAPGAFVKANWNAPLVSRVRLVNAVAVGIGTVMLTMLLVLGMPLTNTVASAWPGESGGERAAVQTLREVRSRPAVAKRLARDLSALECVWH